MSGYMVTLPVTVMKATHTGTLGSDSFFARDAASDDSDSDEDYEQEDADDEEDESEHEVVDGSNNPWVVSQDFTAEIYTRGYRFPDMLSYKELYDTINCKHQMEGGGEPLKTRGYYKTPEDALPYQIHFYCAHCRDHVSERKGCQAKVTKLPKNADSSRSIRHIKEDRRSKFTECKYSITVRLETAHIDDVVVEGDALVGRGLKSKVKGRWFVDSQADFDAGTKRRNFKSSCFRHSGHCKLEASHSRSEGSS